MRIFEKTCLELLLDLRVMGAPEGLRLGGSFGRHWDLSRFAFCSGVLVFDQPVVDSLSMLSFIVSKHDGHNHNLPHLPQDVLTQRRAIHPSSLLESPSPSHRLPRLVSANAGCSIVSYRSAQRATN